MLLSLCLIVQPMKSPFVRTVTYESLSQATKLKDTMLLRREAFAKNNRCSWVDHENHARILSLRDSSQSSDQISLMPLHGVLVRGRVQ